MKEYKKVVFQRQHLEAGSTVRDACFVQCSFVDCVTYPEARSLVERVTFERTTLKSKAIHSVTCREVTVDTCKNTALFIVNNGLFDRVVFRGDFGRWMFRKAPEVAPKGDAAMEAKFYAGVEWALDIREARFKELTLRGVPADKVRRDPERHVVLKKDRLLADRSWEQWEVGFAAVLKASLDRPEEPWILAVGDLGDHAEQDRENLAQLRKAGFAD